MTKQLLAYARSLVTVLRQYRLKGVMTAIQSRAEFAQLIKPLGTRVLVLGAHPGNEVMALGGTLAWYAKLGVPVTVLTFTAGRRGTNTGRLSKPLGIKRKKEQLAGLKCIADDIKLISWGLDERFLVDDQMVISLLELIDELNPDIIYAPSLLDSHPDNQTISHLLGRVLERLPSPRLKALTIAQYELWTPMIPNRVLNIDEFKEQKKEAIECHESQLLCRDYLDAMIGLNNYRAAMLGAGSSAEALFMCNARQYGEFVTSQPTPVIEMLP